MENPLILIVDEDQKNIQILSDSLAAESFATISANDGMDALEKIQEHSPAIVISEVDLPKLNGLQLLEKLKQNPAAATTPIVFLSNRRDKNDRIKCLRGGAKDYMIKPLHVKEVIARIKMILRRMDKLNNRRTETANKLAGSLEEHSLTDLIENFGNDRKTGILSIFNENNNNGEIFFRRGTIIHATYRTLLAEKAIYQMLPWKNGHFVMTFKDPQIEDTISISNFGILLYGFNRQEKRNRFLKKLPSTETTIVLTDRFKKMITSREISPDVAKFLKLINGMRDINQILEESMQDDLVSLEKLVKLYQQGFIKPGQESDNDFFEIKIASRPEIPEKTAPAEVSQSLPGGSQIKLDETLKHPGNGAKDDKPITLGMEKNDHTDNDPEHLPEMPESAFDLMNDETVSIEASKIFSPQNPTFQTINKVQPAEQLPDEGSNSPQDMGNEEKHRRNGIELNETQIDISGPPSLEDEIKIQKEPSESSNNSHPVSPYPAANITYRPGTDIISALGKFAESQDRNTLPQPASQELSSGPDETHIDFPKPVPNGKSHDKPLQEKTPKKSATKKPFSFPLRSYGQPGLTQDDQKIPEKQEMPVPQLARDNAPQKEVPTSTKNGITLDSTDAASPKLFFKHKDRKGTSKGPHAKLFPDLVHISPPVTEVNLLKPPENEPDIGTDERRESTTVKQQKTDVKEKDSILASLQSICQAADTQPGALVIMSNNFLDLEKLMQILLMGEKIQKTEDGTFAFLAYGQKVLSANMTIKIIGVSMDQQFTRLFDTLRYNLCGVIALSASSAKANHGYIGYLKAAIQENYNRPIGLALTRPRKGRNLSPSTVKDLISAAPDDLVEAIDLNDMNSIQSYLKQLSLAST